MGVINSIKIEGVKGEEDYNNSSLKFEYMAMRP